MTVSLTKTFPSDSKVAQDVLRVQYLDALIADAQEERKGITDRLAEFGKGKHTVQGVGTFTVSENNTYDKDAMEAALLPGQVKRCQVAALDGQVVKRLYPDVYAAAKRARGHKVSVAR